MVSTDFYGNRIVAVAALAAFCLSCKGPQANNVAEDTEAAERRRAVLSSLADNVVAPTYGDFAVKAAELQTAVDAWAASGADSDREAARAAWREAMLTWQVAEVYQFGPAGAMSIVEGGEDLRDAIYSWPTNNACRVDQEIVEQAYLDAEAFRSEAVNVRGLDALEYLLFHEGTENACDPSRSINADGSWAAIDAAELEERRADYAATAAAGVATSATDLVTAFDAFASELATAGTGSDVYPSTHEALNSVSDAGFYVESEVKDMKLGEPAGIVNCVEAVCPEQREFIYTDLNAEAVAANLDGFERLYTGGDGPGFEDLLRDAGQGELADELQTKLDDAQASVADDIDFVAALEGDPAPILDAHAKVKEVTDLLKTQFVGILDLELPDRAEGDND